MSQDFLVLKCCHCFLYQVHPTKKAKNWTCKICGSKQSYLKIYFQGSAVDCRKLVQRSNMQVGLQKEQVVMTKSELVVTNIDCREHQSTKRKICKWKKYQSTVESSSSEDDNVLHHDALLNIKTKKGIFGSNYQVDCGSRGKKKRLDTSMRLATTELCRSQTTSVASSEKENIECNLSYASNKIQSNSSNKGFNKLSVSKWNSYCSPSENNCIYESE